LHQLFNRLSEENSCISNKKTLISYPILHKTKTPKVELQHFSFSSKPPNNCALSNDKHTILITKVYESEDGIFVDGKRLVESTPLFTEPYNSENFNIFIFKISSALNIKKFPAHKIEKKCLMLPYPSDDCVVCVPLIHY